MSLPHVILTVLNQHPATGYEITKQFSQSIGFYWKASHQQVYRELGKLDANEWVTCELIPQSGKPDKKTYSITELGQRALQQWLSEPTTQPVVRDEFCAKLAACESIESSEYLAQLKSALESAKRLLSHYLNIDKQFEAEGAHRQIERLTLKRNIVQQQAWIEWAESVVEHLTP
ncbi:PadR family transcriptional regulator [Vibrio ulleungensis]|uniref:PadR family transcriptional regulator n=1 Tax=Vibrio ulleungensis TaxID=2807619 RepID=A0ABS2HP05_9VIBR|nr:PadR family transcriptional regulator [Vibrio ulleungensis]MBM7037784.1 PadR family transcriptional regulator [Vibrio ulleungensis]